jgi:hypothetical protein
MIIGWTDHPKGTPFEITQLSKGLTKRLRVLFYMSKHNPEYNNDPKHLKENYIQEGTSHTRLYIYIGGMTDKWATILIEHL